MWKLYTLLLLLAASLAAQNPNTAVYPGAIPTDTDLLVATNQARTVLSNTITDIETAITVNDASEFLAPGVFAVGLELVKYCSIVGNTFNVCAGGRGFDGTTAVLHISGSAVVGIAAAHFPNQHAAEIKAITTALGVNLGNVQVSGVPASTSFDWSQATQTPEDDLTAATQSSIILTPCPAGVAGANANQYVFLDDADDSPADEAVIIEGGTCTSGGATGTILVTSTSARTGGDYTVSSASAGIREALLSVAGGSTVVIPPGIHLIEERVTLDEDGDALVGSGSPGTTQNAGSPPSGNIFGNEVELNWAGAAGGMMIELLPPTDGVLRGIRLENLGLEGNGSADNGIWTKACTGCYFRHLTLTDHNPSAGDAAFFITSGDGGVSTNKNWRYNRLDSIDIRTTTSSTGACMYFEQGTNTASDANGNVFSFIRCGWFADAEGGIVLKNTDFNIFLSVSATCLDGACGSAFLIPSTANQCHGNVYFSLGGTYQNDCNIGAIEGGGSGHYDTIYGWSSDTTDVSSLITVSNVGAVSFFGRGEVIQKVGSGGNGAIFNIEALDGINLDGPFIPWSAAGDVEIREDQDAITGLFIRNDNNGAGAVAKLRLGRGDVGSATLELRRENDTNTVFIVAKSGRLHLRAFNEVSDGLVISADGNQEVCIGCVAQPTGTKLNVEGVIALDDNNALRFYELDANGENYISFNGGTTRGANYDLEWAVTGDCSALANGGNLTINASNQIVCAADDSTGGGGGIDCSSPAELTIVAGKVTVTASACYLVDTEADASSDALTDIDCTKGDQFIFRPADTARTVVITDGTPIDIQADFLLDHLKDQWSGLCFETNVVVELGRTSSGS